MNKDNINSVAPWEGTLEWVGKPASGVSQSGREWKSIQFTLKYKDQTRDAFITFNAFGADQVAMVESYQLGSNLRVNWFPSSRKTERNGEEKWWSSNQVISVGLASPPPSAPAVPYDPYLPSKADDDLPPDDSLPF